MKPLLCTLVALLLVLAPHTAHAHKPSDSQLHLSIDGDRIDGRLDVALRDLDAALVLDADGDGSVTWAEVTAAAPRITAYITARFELVSDAGPCAIALSPAALVDLSDGTYDAQPFTATCPARPHQLDIRYALLFDIDPQHQALVRIEHDGEPRTLIIRSAQPVTDTLNPAAGSFTAFVAEGVHHIWSGLDHILFLLCLVLPAVYQRRGQRWTAAESLTDVVLEVFEIVTAFTLAHSITLVVSTIGLVQLPSRFVETAIALSVFAAAANNLVRVIDARWAVAFSLGLLHGFGFSAVLIDLGLPSHELVTALLGFNLGVEIGQAAIVLVAVPVLFALRRTPVYQLLLWGGSGAVAAVALVWAWHRFSA